MTSQHSIHDIKAIISHVTWIISDSTSTVSLSSHPDYRSYNPHCMYNRPTICMTSYELHMTSHPLFMILLFMISHHTHCIHVITSSIPVIESTVAAPLLIVYWLSHTYYMCDIKPTICMTSQEFYMTSHSLFMKSQYCIPTSHPLYSWQHTHSLWHHILYTCDITATVSMTRHLLCLWHHLQYIWHLTWCMNDNTIMVSDITLNVSV